MLTQPCSYSIASVIIDIDSWKPTVDQHIFRAYVLASGSAPRAIVAQQRFWELRYSAARLCEMDSCRGQYEVLLDARSGCLMRACLSDSSVSDGSGYPTNRLILFMSGSGGALPPIPTPHSGTLFTSFVIKRFGCLGCVHENLDWRCLRDLWCFECRCPQRREVPTAREGRTAALGPFADWQFTASGTGIAAVLRDRTRAHAPAYQDFRSQFSKWRFCPKAADIRCSDSLVRPMETIRVS